MLINKREKRNREYYIEFYNEISVSELEYAKSDYEFQYIVNKNVNVTKLLEDFIGDDELVDFYRVEYLLDNAKSIGFIPIKPIKFTVTQ